MSLHMKKDARFAIHTYKVNEYSYANFYSIIANGRDRECIQLKSSRS